MPPAILAFCGQLTRVIDKLDDRHFSVITLPATKLDDACIAAVTVFITHAEFSEKTLDGFNPSGTLDRSFLLSLFTTKSALLCFESAVPGMEKAGCLTAKMRLTLS